MSDDQWSMLLGSHVNATRRAVVLNSDGNAQVPIVPDEFLLFERLAYNVQSRTRCHAIINFSSTLFLWILMSWRNKALTVLAQHIHSQAQPRRNQIKFIYIISNLSPIRFSIQMLGHQRVQALSISSSFPLSLSLSHKLCFERKKCFSKCSGKHISWVKSISR